MDTDSPEDVRAKARGATKDQKLRAMRLWATGLFLLAAASYVAATIFAGAHTSLAYVAAFSEAAIVGALADWVAVAFAIHLGLDSFPTQHATLYLLVHA